MCKPTCLLLGLLLGSCGVLAQDETESQESENKAKPSWSTGLPERQAVPKKPTATLRTDIKDEPEIDMSGFGIERPNIGLEGFATETADPAEDETAAPIQAEQDSAVVESTPPPVTVDEPAAATEPVADVALEASPEDSPALAEQQPDDEPVQTQSGGDATEIDADDTANLALQETAPVEQSTPIDTPPAQEPALLTDSTPVDVANADDDVFSESNLQASVTNPAPSSKPRKNGAFNWQLLRQNELEYPVKALRQSQTGWVDINVTINAQGLVVETDVMDKSRGGMVFVSSAVKAVKSWQFEAPSDYGISENMSKVYRIEFQF